MVLPGPINALKSLRRPFAMWKRNWFAIEAIPLYIVTIGVPSGGLWYFFKRAAVGPEIVWTRENPTPWNTISQDETPKLGTSLGPRKDATGLVQHQYNHRWTRPSSIRKEKSGNVATYESFLNRPVPEEENRGGTTT